MIHRVLSPGYFIHAEGLAIVGVLHLEQTEEDDEVGRDADSGEDGMQIATNF